MLGVCNKTGGGEDFQSRALPTGAPRPPDAKGQQRGEQEARSPVADQLQRDVVRASGRAFPNHSPRMLLNESALAAGIAMHVGVAL